MNKSIEQLQSELTGNEQYNHLTMGNAKIGGVL